MYYFNVEDNEIDVCIYINQFVASSSSFCTILISAETCTRILLGDIKFSTHININTEDNEVDTYTYYELICDQITYRAPLIFISRNAKKYCLLLFRIQNFQLVSNVKFIER